MSRYFMTIMLVIISMRASADECEKIFQFTLVKSDLNVSKDTVLNEVHSF